MKGTLTSYARDRQYLLPKTLFHITLNNAFLPSILSLRDLLALSLE
jgi:hypothetical protein